MEEAHFFFSMYNNINLPQIFSQNLIFLLNKCCCNVNKLEIQKYALNFNINGNQITFNIKMPYEQIITFAKQCILK